MKEHWIKLKEWWSSLGTRERKSLSVAMIALSFFMVYQFIWQPMQNNTETLRRKIASNEKLLVWMKNADILIAKNSANGKTAEKIDSPVILLGLLQRDIDNAGLQQSLIQLKQSNNDSLELHFQKVQFDELIKLLIQISKDHGVEISQMSAIADSSPGVVNADVYVKVS